MGRFEGTPRQSLKDLWIAEKQEFQRLAGVTESSYEDLEKQYSIFRNKKIDNRYN